MPHFNRPDNRHHCRHGTKMYTPWLSVHGALSDHTGWRHETALDIIDLQSAAVTVFVGP